MKRKTRSVSIFVLLAVCGALLFLLFRSTNGVMPSTASRPIQSPINTPPTSETAVATVEYDPAIILTAMGTIAVEGTTTAEARAKTSTPVTGPSPTVLPNGETCFINATHQFALLIPSGWVTQDSLSSVNNPVSYLYNYDPSSRGGHNWDSKELKIQFSINQLTERVSAEQWVQDLIGKHTSPEAPIPTTATEPVSYKLGSYVGQSFTLESAGVASLNIILVVSEREVLVIVLWPSSSSSLDEGLSILSTINVSPNANCTK